MFAWWIKIFKIQSFFSILYSGVFTILERGQGLKRLGEWVWEGSPLRAGGSPVGSKVWGGGTAPP